MDIEDLSKTQLLLLTILVNFVIAIATAVMTVSLLDQAPQTVTQTVNRIVENTVETVTTQVPVINDSSPPSTEELLTSAIASNASRVVSIRRSSDSEVIGRGFYVLTARAILTVPFGLMPDHIHITFADGTTAEADRIRDDGRIVLYQFPENVTLPKVRSAELVASNTLKQGQTLIGLADDGSVVTGLLTKIDENGIQADLPVLSPGSVLFTLGGDIAGVSAGTAAIIPAEFIGTLLAEPAP